MNRIVAVGLVLGTMVSGCQSQPVEDVQEQTQKAIPEFSLQDFYSESNELDSTVNVLFSQLNDTQRLAQMVITSAGKLGKPETTVNKLVSADRAGGVIFLNGDAAEHVRMMGNFDSLNASSSLLPLWYAADAEPNLFKRRIGGVKRNYPDAVSIESNEQAADIAKDIAAVLDSLGFHQNYAPVVDLSPNNEAIKSRSFGSDADSVTAKSGAFIEATQKAGVVATAKHFPGHGYVKGDTHKKTVFQDGELLETVVYKPLIEQGVISIMVAHVAVRNNERYNTNDLPSSCSRVIVTDLLREEMGFDGIIVTDALNMMAAVNAGESGPVLAAKAGCDMILMPPNENAFIDTMLNEMAGDEALTKQIHESVKRIIRMKLCSGMKPNA